MADRKQQLDNQIREMPLLERLDKSRQIIGKLCSEGRPPKMTVPVQAYDEDIFMSVSIKDAMDELARLRAFETEAWALHEAIMLITDSFVGSDLTSQRDFDFVLHHASDEEECNMWHKVRKAHLSYLATRVPAPDPDGGK